MNVDIEDTVKPAQHTLDLNRHSHSSQSPGKQWELIGTDLFTINDSKISFVLWFISANF